MSTPHFKAHPWHGISAGELAPETVTAFIEIVPSDTIKYEVDKASGYLKIDRPQKFSNVVPALYGFIPRTYCDTLIAEYAAQQSGREVRGGDGDPLDICVLCAHAVTHGDILLQAVPIGGLRMIDKQEADDKIIAVLRNDEVYGQWKSIGDVPASLVERLRHYFLTYKSMPGDTASAPVITHVYDVHEAHEVIRRSMRDYHNAYGQP